MSLLKAQVVGSLLRPAKLLEQVQLLGRGAGARGALLTW